MWPGRLFYTVKTGFREWEPFPSTKTRFLPYRTTDPGSKRVRRFAFVIFHHSKLTECLDFHLQGQSVPYQLLYLGSS